MELALLLERKQDNFTARVGIEYYVVLEDIFPQVLHTERSRQPTNTRRAFARLDAAAGKRSGGSTDGGMSFQQSDGLIDVDSVVGGTGIEPVAPRV